MEQSNPIMQFLNKERMGYKEAVLLLPLLYSMNGCLRNIFDLKACLYTVNHILINYIGSLCPSEKVLKGLASIC